MTSEPMQVISLVGGPADGVVTLVPTGAPWVAIRQPGLPDESPKTGRYVPTSAFSTQGYPAWEWEPTGTREGP